MPKQGKSRAHAFSPGIPLFSLWPAVHFMTTPMPPLDDLLNARQSVASADQDLKAIFDMIVNWSLALVPHAKGAMIQMIKGDDLIYRAASGVAQGLVGQATASGDRKASLPGPLLWEDVAQDGAPELQAYRDAGMRALMKVPLVENGHVIGALEFYALKPSAFSKRDLEVAQLIANLLMSGLAIVNVEAVLRGRQDSAARFEAITEALPQLIWTMTPKGRITYCNRRALDFVGLKDIRTFLNEPLHFIPPSHRLQVLRQWLTCSRGHSFCKFESPVQTRQGDQRWMLIHVLPVRQRDGSVQEWIGAATDIDERKAMELALQEAVRMRDLLLHEVNHRVKNSLQIVTGLLALQANRIKDAGARQRLLDARAQISTIAQIHQSIYRAHRHDEVEFISFLRSLTESLVGRATAGQAELVFDVPDILLLPFDRGVPVALVAGEIITNAVKHGAGRGRLRITVSVRQSEGETVIAIADNGPGLPAGFSREKMGGLGMEIIFGLAEQAHGRIEIDESKGGAHFRLVLPAQR